MIPEVEHLISVAVSRAAPQLDQGACLDIAKVIADRLQASGITEESIVKAFEGTD